MPDCDPPKNKACIALSPKRTLLQHVRTAPTGPRTKFFEAWVLHCSGSHRRISTSSWMFTSEDEIVRSQTATTSITSVTKSSWFCRTPSRTQAALLSRQSYDAGWLSSHHLRNFGEANTPSSPRHSASSSSRWLRFSRPYTRNKQYGGTASSTRSASTGISGRLGCR